MTRESTGKERGSKPGAAAKAKSEPNKTKPKDNSDRARRQGLEETSPTRGDR
jgi:hypothetical protein